MNEHIYDGHPVSIRTEILAGVTTFLSMACVLALYPNIMSKIGLPPGGAMIAAIPAFAITSAMFIVGFCMISQFSQINFQDFPEALPCLVTIIMMPFSYSIADGIFFGFISWTVINLLCGRKDRVNLFLIILSTLFILKYIFL